MDANTLFTKRMYSVTKNIGLLSEMKAFLDFMQNPVHVLEKDPKSSIIPSWVVNFLKKVTFSSIF